MTKRLLAAAACAILLGVGCKTSTTGPTNLNVQSLGGTWVSSVMNFSPSTCTNVVWAVTTLTATTGSGTFSATCSGVPVSGSASGTLTATGLSWTANATAVVPGFPTCAISLSGTATLEANGIRIPYSGTTCLGPVSGTELLKKQ